MRTTNNQSSLTLSRLQPGDLGTLDDDQFRKVVDSDLRRKQRSTQDRITEAVAQALRSEHLDRWHQELSRILASAESQLDGRRHDYERSMAELRRRELTEPDPQVKMEMEDITIRHHDAQARTTRFVCSVREALVEADELRDSRNRSSESSMVVRERNHYAERAARLESGIRSHRQAILADVTDSEDIDPIDTQLWSLLEEAS